MSQKKLYIKNTMFEVKLTFAKILIWKPKLWSISYVLYNNSLYFMEQVVNLFYILLSAYKLFYNSRSKLLKYKTVNVMLYHVWELRVR